MPERAETNRNVTVLPYLQNCGTNLTEFAIVAGKVYLSPVIDCFDGVIVSWNIGTAPDSLLVNEMLEAAISTLSPSEHPIVHTDRGSHYR